MERDHQQLEGDELCGPKSKIWILKLGLELGRAGGVVDLTVDDRVPPKVSPCFGGGDLTARAIP